MPEGKTNREKKLFPKESDENKDKRTANSPCILLANIKLSEYSNTEQQKYPQSNAVINIQKGKSIPIAVVTSNNETEGSQRYVKINSDNQNHNFKNIKVKERRIRLYRASSSATNRIIPNPNPGIDLKALEEDRIKYKISIPSKNVDQIEDSSAIKKSGDNLRILSSRSSFGTQILFLFNKTSLT